MVKIEFVKMQSMHEESVMAIFNYYVENSFAAYADKKLSLNFFQNILEITKGYPAFVIELDKIIVGFCFLRAYNPFSTFKNTAEVSYFIDYRYFGKGLGRMALDKLITEAQNMEISTLLANVSSKNDQSLSFHKKNGFVECGRFPRIGNKFNESFDIIWFLKGLNPFEKKAI